MNTGTSGGAMNRWSGNCGALRLGTCLNSRLGNDGGFKTVELLVFYFTFFIVFDLLILYLTPSESNFLISANLNTYFMDVL